MPEKMRKILIIDKDNEEKQALKEVLQNHYTVLICNNVQEALSFLKIIDINIVFFKPEKPFELRKKEFIKLQAINENNIEFFAVIDKDSLEEGEKAFKNMVMGFFVRPFDAKAILETIGRKKQGTDNSLSRPETFKRDFSEYRMKEMANRLAHAFKNPLASIKTFFQLFPERFGDSKFRVGYYNIVCKDVERISSLIEDMTGLTHPLKPSLGRGDINKIIKSLLSDYQQKFLSTKIEVSENYLEEIPQIRFDEKGIKRALSSLIQNAIQSMKSGGTLSVKTDIIAEENKKRYVEIQISDTGCGIPRNILNKITLPFYTTKSDSLGLGLTLATMIIRAHRGRLIVKSRKRKGTTFVIHIPSYL